MNAKDRRRQRRQLAALRRRRNQIAATEAGLIFSQVRQITAATREGSVANEAQAMALVGESDRWPRVWRIAIQITPSLEAGRDAQSNPS